VPAECGKTYTCSISITIWTSAEPECSNLRYGDTIMQPNIHSASTCAACTVPTDCISIL